jgi:hypothetical protein
MAARSKTGGLRRMYDLLMFNLNEYFNYLELDLSILNFDLRSSNGEIGIGLWACRIMEKVSGVGMLG